LGQADSFQRRLTLVSAPAGYGKTTIIAEWLTGKNADGVAWLSLDEGDNDPVRFLIYLIAAMNRVNVHIGTGAQAMLQSPQPPPMESVLTALINDIASSSQSLILALDDYHAIHSPAIHQQVTFLLDHLPPQMHLVVLTREDPLLPVARLRSRGQALELRQDDLRLTGEEICTFLCQVMGLDLSEEDITALERRTEGWIAGLQLAALSMQGQEDLKGFVRAFTGSSRYILDYLIEEVFVRQTDVVQDFLMKTSILGQLNGPLCDAVTEGAESQRLLEELERANLFIVPLDQQREWYRYHHLFAELLRNRLRMRMTGEETALHGRASRWFEAHGLAAEAIHHALAAQDWERAAQLIQGASTERLKHGEVHTVIRWFQALPQEILLSNPKLCFEYCWPLLLACQYDAAGPLLAGIEQAAQDIPTFLGEVYAAQAYLARGVSDHARMVERSQRALALLPISVIWLLR
jgi:LuxR family maltose regulon positive regulatory protein